MPAKRRLKLFVFIEATFSDFVPWNNCISFASVPIDFFLLAYTLYKRGFCILSIFWITTNSFAWPMRSVIFWYSLQVGESETKWKSLSFGWGSQNAGTAKIKKGLPSVFRNPTNECLVPSTRNICRIYLVAPATITEDYKDLPTKI